MVPCAFAVVPCVKVPVQICIFVLKKKNDIESVQTEVARIVTGATKLCNIASLCNNLKWDSLSSRRSKHKLVIFYKIFHGLTPSYLSDLIPINNQNRYNLKNVSDEPLIHSEHNK